MLWAIENANQRSDRLFLCCPPVNIFFEPSILNVEELKNVSEANAVLTEWARCVIASHAIQLAFTPDGRNQSSNCGSQDNRPGV
jgi:hypothetical protein